MSAAPFRTARLARRAHGLTLLELLIGVSMLAILLALAAPDFGGWIRAYRLTLQTSDFSASLAYARSEALKRGTRVGMCKSAAPTAAVPACSTSGNWAAGWLVYVDHVHLAGNTAGVIDGPDTVLRIGEPLQGASVAADNNLANWLAYTPDGLAVAGGGSAAGTFRLCQGTKGQALVLNIVGRVTTSKVDCT
jgi:type IV fimbrial biogenesis protein FimT